MSRIENEATPPEEALVGKEELERTNRVYYRHYDEFLEVDLSESYRVNAFRSRLYVMTDLNSSTGLYLNANADSFVVNPDSALDVNDTDYKAATTLQDTLKDQFATDPSCARLIARKQVEASNNTESLSFSREDLLKYAELSFGISGIIHARAANYIAKQADTLNALLLELKSLQPWVVANMQDDASGPKHIAARLVEFRVHGAQAGVPTLEPVVLTKGHERALLPFFDYTVDPGAAILFDDIRRNA